MERLPALNQVCVLSLRLQSYSTSLPILCLCVRRLSGDLNVAVTMGANSQRIVMASEPEDTCKSYSVL